MKITEIVSFLAIVEAGNISKAANNLFISQSTLSQRLKRLEEKLNVKLIFRGKGEGSIRLSAKGKELVPLAQSLMNIYEDIDSLENLSSKLPLTVAAVAIINEGTFLPLYNNLIQNNSLLSLTIKTFHSNEIYKLISNNHADIGFVYNEIQYPDVITTPIFSEEMFLVTKTKLNYSNDISINDLDPQKEIYLDWGNKYKNWHDRKLNKDLALIRVDTGTSMIKNLNKKGSWGIAPASLIRSYEDSEKLLSFTLKEHPPKRITYQLVSKHMKISQKETVQLFQEEMHKFIIQSEIIQSLLSI